MSDKLKKLILKRRLCLAGIILAPVIGIPAFFLPFIIIGLTRFIGVSFMIAGPLGFLFLISLFNYFETSDDIERERYKEEHGHYPKRTYDTIDTSFGLPTSNDWYFNGKFWTRDEQ